MLKHPDYTRERLRQLCERMRETFYCDTRPISEILVAGPVDRISYEEAQKLEGFRAAKLGDQFGPQWATFWFRLKAQVPKEWKGKRIDLLWGTHSEATLWVNGRSIQGLNYDLTELDGGARMDAVLLPRAKGNEVLEMQIEMACNKTFGYDQRHAPFLGVSPYVLEHAEIAVFDELAWELYHDFLVLQSLEVEQLKDLNKTWGGELLHELNRFANTYDINDRSTWKESSQILKSLYERTNADSVHELSAIGHAHLDTAWLWPVAETQRKAVRTFSSQTTYMDQYPEYRFACPQAQQYAWVKERNPDLFKRVKQKVKTGQFVPVGGTWVEPDCNIPSGEALSRQFLHGQRFFRKEFGLTCTEFWNPDVFGYNGQLPQICRLSGISRFLTCKLSWNRFNKPLHHTFIWEGIDGSQILTHFPPSDNYGSVAGIEEIRRSAHAYKDNDRSRYSLFLFGYSDGGGGPTKRMMEVFKRVQDLQGVPRSNMRSARDFFDLLEKDYTDRVKVVGELYFEYHRGTYTTQAATKRGNRKSEFLLHDVEFLSAMAAALAAPTAKSAKASKSGFSYPSQELDSLWKTLLINQFHDILPGSSIRLVYEDTLRDYEKIAAEAGQLRQKGLEALLGGLKPEKVKPSKGGNNSGEEPAETTVPVNTIGFARSEVAHLSDGRLAYVEAPAYGVGRIVDSPDHVTVLRQEDGHVLLENTYLRAELDPEGTLVSLIEKTTGREALSAPGNQMLLYADEPTAFDAWDIDPFHMEQETPCKPAHSCKIAEETPLRSGVVFERKIGQKSKMRQTVRLAANSRRLEFHTEVDWHENQKMLKVAFPVNVRAMNATYEMQFGCVERPTHFNTPYDLARYEVPGHKWADLSEYGFGVALLSESKYGFSTYENTMRMSLLRSPKHPDPEADMGHHEFTYAVMPHSGGWQHADVVGEAYRFNVPLLFGQASSHLPAVQSFASVDDVNLVLDTIKKAEDSDALVLRLYECHGARGTAKVKIAAPFKSALYSNILEEDGAPAVSGNGEIEVPYTPFQVITLKLKS